MNRCTQWVAAEAAEVTRRMQDRLTDKVRLLTSAATVYPPNRPFSNRSTLLLLGLIGLLLLHFTIPAATIEAALDRDTIGLGDTAMLKVTIAGGSGQEQPRIPVPAGIRLSQVGNTMSFSLINGRQTMSAELTYSVTASRIGTFTLGPVVANVAGQPTRSAPIALKVVPADDPAAARNDGLDRAAFLHLSLPNRDLYVGETFVADIYLYAIGGRLKQAPQISADGFTVGKLLEAGQESNIRTNNRVYSRLRFQQPLTAARAGDLSVQALNCVLDIPLPRRLGFSDILDDAFFGLREGRTFNLTTPPTRLKVRPLPRQGVPGGFQGAVGDFRIVLSASPTNVQAGDPITVRIDISGRGNFDAVQLPEQPDWRGFRLYPPNAKFEPADPHGLTGVKRFEQVVAPETADLAELPAFAFAFFDPESGTYRTLRTTPVAIRVSAGAPTPSVPGSVTAAPSPAVRQPELAPLKPHLGPIVAQSSMGPLPPWFFILGLFPPISWIAFRAWRMHQHRLAADPRLARQRALHRRVDEGLNALEELARRTESDPFFATLFRVLQEAVAAQIDRPPASITEGVVDSALAGRGVSAEALASLHQLFQACNLARYAPVRARGDLEAIRREAASVCMHLRTHR